MKKYWQPIGHANIYVGNVIKNWEKNVKQVFLKKRKTEAEERFIRKEAKEDFYVEYAIKKYEKMELITKEGVLRPRELDYAEAVLNVINNLKGLTKAMNVDMTTIKSYVEIEFRNLKLVGSIIGIKMASDRVMGVLNLHKAKWKTEGKKVAIVLELEEAGESRKRIEAIRIEYDKVINDIEKAIEMQMKELEKYKAIKERYNQHTK